MKSERGFTLAIASQPFWYSIVTLKNVRMTGSLEAIVEQNIKRKKHDKIFVVNTSSQVVNASVNLPIFFFAGKTFREVTINLVRWEKKNTDNSLKNAHIHELNLLDINVAFKYPSPTFPLLISGSDFFMNVYFFLDFVYESRSNQIISVVCYLQCQCECISSTKKNIFFLQAHDMFILCKTFWVSLIKTWFWTKLLGVFSLRPCWEPHSITQ